MLIYNIKNKYGKIIEQVLIAKYEVEQTDINTFQVTLYARDEDGDFYEAHTDEIVLYEDVELLFKEMRTNYLVETIYKKQSITEEN